MLFVLVLVALAPLVLLVAYGGRRLRDPLAGLEGDYAGPLPATGLVAPVKGAPDGMRQCLQALMEQEHPNYRVAFVVEDMVDPAVGVIQDVLQESAAKGGNHGQLVVAGRSETCGQKNWNQLAGLRALSEGGEPPEILAFCDSTHLPRPDWLRRLSVPLVLGRSQASTAYHHVFPGKRSLAAVGRMVSVLALYMMQEIPAVTQPWGGSMAIRRKTFERLGVAGHWAQNVVDDVSLARLLEDAGLRAEAVPTACMQTRLERESFRGWRVWLERQWLYLKFIFPGSWRAVGAFLYLNGLLLPLSLAALLAGVLGAGEAGLAGLGAFYLLVLVLLGLWARECHPQPEGRLLWLAAFFATLLMAGWCHLRTWFMKGIAWGGVRYDVGPEGRVLAVKRDS